MNTLSELISEQQIHVLPLWKEEMLKLLKMLKGKEQPHQLLDLLKIKQESLEHQLKDKLLPTPKILYMLLKDLLEDVLMTLMYKRTSKHFHIKLLEILMEMLGSRQEIKVFLLPKPELLFYKKWKKLLIHILENQQIKQLLQYQLILMIVKDKPPKMLEKSPA